MIYTHVISPIYASADKKSIACEVTFTHLLNPVPFVAMDNDPEPHGRQLFADLVAGKFGAISLYAPPAVAAPLTLAAPKP